MLRSANPGSCKHEKLQPEFYSTNRKLFKICLDCGTRVLTEAGGDCQHLNTVPDDEEKYIGHCGQERTRIWWICLDCGLRYLRSDLT